MNKEKTAGIVALALILISLLGVQQGYAKTVGGIHPVPPGGIHPCTFVNGGCGETWRSVGSLNTDSAGFGNLAQTLNLPSGHCYILEFQNSACSVAHADDSQSR